MNYELNIKDLELIISGLDAAADRACSIKEEVEYNKLNKRLSESLEDFKEYKKYYDSKYNNNTNSN
jgi:hypothetical protein